MLCPSCNQEIPDSVPQCPNCGYQFANADQPDMSLLQQVDTSNPPFTPICGEQIILVARYMQQSYITQTYYQQTPEFSIGGFINIGEQPDYNNPQYISATMYVYGAVYITNMRVVFHAQNYSCPRCIHQPPFNPYVDSIWYNPQAIDVMIQTYKGQDPSLVNNVDVKNYNGHITVQVSKQFDYDTSNGRVTIDRDVLIIPSGKTGLFDRFVDKVREDFRSAFGDKYQATIDQGLPPDLVNQISQMSACVNNNYDRFKQEALS
ncbi:zinc ribbon domain-containing protein [Stygiolobus caldivivus]|uniref:Zinc-ribbon domain-containing protein n=1 Tax=Stygiolobus caldivivus TaxID=2824673 RepID=A0A8D5ZHK3_9CREN|nr:zinc ribbon domain-containing protein [Stygiolobus caldivivus]BCU69779.1 hypothetical protein KN1_10760 [Stygiolobus caldivivus]